METNRRLGSLLALSLMLGLMACAPEEDGLPIIGQPGTTPSGTTASPSPSPSSTNDETGVDGNVSGDESLPPISTSPSPSPSPEPTPTPFTVQVQAPRGLAFDGSGNAWIACFGDGSSSGSLAQMSASGELLKEIMVGVGPEAVTVDGGGNAWVANTGSTLVSKISPTGSVSHVDVSSAPRGLALDGAGNLWVAAASGAVTVSLSDHATQSIAALDAGGVAFQGGKAWVTDRANGQVNVYGSTGTLDRSISTGSRPGVIRASGNILWVLNHSGNSVTRIDAGSGDAKANLDPGGASPADLAFDASGNAWVSTPSTGRVTKFSPSGAYLETRAIGTAPHGLAAASDGKLWVTDRDANRVHVITP